MMRILFAAFVVLACTAAPPAATQGPTQPRPTATPAPTPTLAPTPTMAPVPSPTTVPATTAVMTPPPSAEASSNVLAISTAKDTSGADYFVGPSGHALYIFDHDSAGKSTCNGDCATTWPPLTIATGQTVIGAGIAKPFQTIKRDDGSTQVAYNNLPLYYFSGDTGPTDTNGDGIGSVWHLARP